MKVLTGTTEDISKILYQDQVELSKENLDVDDAADEDVSEEHADRADEKEDHARRQAEEARGEAMLMRRRPAAKDTISVVTRMRETPVKKR